VHFTLEAGNGGLSTVDWERVKQLSKTTGTPYINLHLDARQGYYPEYSVDTMNGAEVEKVLNIMLSDVRLAVKHFGPERVIVENSPYQGEEGSTMCLCIQPALISQVVEETGCGLLLDISHAIITARSLGLDPAEYMSQLPVHAVKELHFAGIHHNQTSGRWMDHLSILEEDWCWLDWVLSQIHAGKWNHPWLLAFEYGGVGEPFKWRSNPQVMAEQVPRLYRLVKSPAS
jgi:uncharacterized protein (UPF0276 family)